MMIDRIESGNGQVFSDDSFEDYDSETEENDKRLSDMPTLNQDPTQFELPKTENQKPKEDDWEDVEIDD